MKKASTTTTKASAKTAAPKTVAGVPLRGATRVTTAFDDATMPDPAVRSTTGDDRKVHHLELPDGTDMAAVAALISAGVAAFNTQTASAKTRSVEAEDPSASWASAAEETPMEKALNVLRDQLSGAEIRFNELRARLEPVLAYPQDEDVEGKKDPVPACWATSPLHRQINDVMERVARLAYNIAEVHDRVTV
jgi:hypothetical protein